MLDRVARAIIAGSLATLIYWARVAAEGLLAPYVAQAAVKQAIDSNQTTIAALAIVRWGVLAWMQYALTVTSVLVVFTAFRQRKEPQ